MKGGPPKLAARVREGDVLAGKYRVEGVLGQGGMGVVVAAQHLELGQRVALKFLLPEACEHPDSVARFLREARSAVRIRSEHVARVIDVGRLDGGAPYMVMELLQGSDLGNVLQTRGPLPIDDAVGYVLQACEAIAEAHALGMVHRDLKPSNLFLTRRADGSPLVKVLDFGISKTTAFGSSGIESAGMTKTTAILGSPLYMSPEQMRSSKNVDARTDVWSLGIILHELLTARPAFEADTIPGLMAMIAADPPAPLRSKRPDAPAELENLILRCLEKDVTRRVANVAKLATALAPFGPKGSRVSVERIVRIIEGAGVTATALAPPSSGDFNATAHTAGSWGSTGSSTARRGRSAAAIAAGAFVLAGAAFAVWRARPAGDASSSALAVASTSSAFERGASSSQANDVPPVATQTPLATVSATPSAMVLATAAPVATKASPRVAASVRQALPPVRTAAHPTNAASRPPAPVIDPGSVR